MLPDPPYLADHPFTQSPAELLQHYPQQRIEETQARLTAFWHGAHLGRPVVSVTCDAPQYIQQYDVEAMMSNALECLAREAFLPGDNVPGFWPDLGPLVLASAFGGRIRFEETPPWIDPVVYDRRMWAACTHRR